MQNEKKKKSVINFLSTPLNTRLPWSSNHHEVTRFLMHIRFKLLGYPKLP